MLLYVTLGTNDIERARRLHDAVLPVLGYKLQRLSDEEIGDSEPMREHPSSRLWIVTPFNRRRAAAGNGSMIALSAETRADVDAFDAGGPRGGAVLTTASAVLALLSCEFLRRPYPRSRRQTSLPQSAKSRNSRAYFTACCSVSMAGPIRLARWPETSAPAFLSMRMKGIVATTVSPAMT